MSVEKKPNNLKSGDQSSSQLAIKKGKSNFLSKLLKLKKNWFEYLIEFVLIFVAVFSGFIADKIREDNNEEKIEKQYITSLVDDLTKDVSNFEFFINEGKYTARTIDTLIRGLSDEKLRQNTSSIYITARNITRHAFPYEIFDRTYSEMKSSGTLRIISYHYIADSLSTYYSSIPLVNSQQNFILNFVNDYIRKMPTIFDMSAMHKMYVGSDFIPNAEIELNVRKLMPLKKLSYNPKLVFKNEDDLNSMISTLHYLYARTLRLNGMILQQQRRANVLIDILKEKYHIK